MTLWTRKLNRKGLGDYNISLPVKAQEDFLIFIQNGWSQLILNIKVFTVFEPVTEPGVFNLIREKERELQMLQLFEYFDPVNFNTKKALWRVAC